MTSYIDTGFGELSIPNLGTGFGRKKHSATMDIAKTSPKTMQVS